jgi:hypothetical protein
MPWAWVPQSLFLPLPLPPPSALLPLPLPPPSALLPMPASSLCLAVAVRLLSSVAAIRGSLSRSAATSPDFIYAAAACRSMMRCCLELRCGLTALFSHSEWSAPDLEACRLQSSAFQTVSGDAQRSPLLQFTQTSLSCALAHLQVLWLSTWAACFVAITRKTPAIRRKASTLRVQIASPGMQF